MKVGADGNDAYYHVTKQNQKPATRPTHDVNQFNQSQPRPRLREFHIRQKEKKRLTIVNKIMSSQRVSLCLSPSLPRFTWGRLIFMKDESICHHPIPSVPGRLIET